jgi:hypothetical protein
VTTNERDPASGPIEAAETLRRDVEFRVCWRAIRGVTAASVRKTPCDLESTLSKSGSLVRGLAPKVETPNGYDLGTSRFQQSRCGKYGGKTRQEHSEREAKGKRGWLRCFNASERARGHEDREDQ